MYEMRACVCVAFEFGLTRMFRAEKQKAISFAYVSIRACL
jgi:hypothetical protein